MFLVLGYSCKSLETALMYILLFLDNFPKRYKYIMYTILYTISQKRNRAKTMGLIRPLLKSTGKLKMHKEG